MLRFPDLCCVPGSSSPMSIENQFNNTTTKTSFFNTESVYSKRHHRRKSNVPISWPTNLVIIDLTHCSLMIASLAFATASLSVKSTPWNVGGTFGFFARNASDSGVGMMERRWRRSTVTMKVSAVGSTATLATDSVPQHDQVVYRDTAPSVVS